MPLVARSPQDFELIGSGDFRSLPHIRAEDLGFAKAASLCENSKLSGLA